ncbi:MAG: DUF4147 domain-containing protein [Bacteroidales bacterium]|jgi:glycerate-2-kinase|nr:DUF4147 domain-containing protein [Bacteroidales bacterium]
MNSHHSTNRRHTAEQIFRAAVNSVMPDRLVSSTVSVERNMLRIAGIEYSLGDMENIWVIGAGKASAMMALEMEKILGSRITGGRVIVKYGHAVELKKITVSEAGHPVPDHNGFEASAAVLDIARRAGATDLVICLLSGGGSSLLCDAPEELTADDIAAVNDMLVTSGATINEINAVRKHLSGIKGGRLAVAIYPAQTVSLILSDVTGDLLDVIASGPTAPDPTTFADAIDVIDKYGIREALPSRIIKFLFDGANGGKTETPKPGDPVFNSVSNIITGSNRIALESARLKAAELNLATVIVDNCLQGDVAPVSEYLVETALRYQADASATKPACLLFGGETTVKTSGSGTGGRNQHLALLCARLLRNKRGITILCAGTDGTDGPTDAAGAVVDSETAATALQKGLDPDTYLSDFNSYNFFKHSSGHIITGPSLTNVMDIVIVIVDRE